jgi:crotonobetainyl-CoA:carnitine CoA-transferase CaiB-like acyl-CoA transferase
MARFGLSYEDEGQLVEVNLLNTLLSSMVNQSAGYAMAGVVPGILGNKHPSITPYEDLAGAFALAERLGLRPTVPLEDLTVVANPIGLSRTPPEYRRRPPRLGEHTGELS